MDKTTNIISMGMQGLVIAFCLLCLAIVFYLYETDGGPYKKPEPALSAPRKGGE